MWYYKSPIGNIYIKQLSDGRYGMEYANVVWESCDTPQAVADNVYMQCTGCSKWDLLNTIAIDIPHSLDEWDKG